MFSHHGVAPEPKADAASPVVDVEVLLYVHRNRRLIRDGSPRRPPPLSPSTYYKYMYL